MGLIKSTNAPTSAQAFSMKDIESHARGILLKARQQAEQLLAAAQAEAEVMKAEARAQGLAEGRSQGLAKGREEGLAAGKEQALAEQKAALSAAVGGLTKALGAIEQSRREIEAAGLTDVINLAIAIAERVTMRQGSLDPKVAVASVGEALKLSIHASDVRIAINPAQRATLAEAMPRLQLQWPQLKHIELLGDPDIAPGGCRVYTASGEVDARLEVQLQRVVADLLPERQEDLHA